MATTAPGQVDVEVPTDDGMKDKCIPLYKKAHELRKPKYQSYIAVCDQKIEAGNKDMSGIGGVMVVGQYTELKGKCEIMMSYDGDQFVSARTFGNPAFHIPHGG